MKEKARDLVYLDPERYISLETIKIFYWGSLFIQIALLVVGVAGIKTNGVILELLFPLLSPIIWSLLYWVFVLKIQGAQKTFELRFLVNGVSGLLFFFLFWILFATLGILQEFEDQPMFEFDFCLWVLLFYIIFSVTYVALIVSGVHNGVYKKAKKSKQAKGLMRKALYAVVLPSLGIVCVYISEMLKGEASNSIQKIIMTFIGVSVIFLPALAHINFVQYYYCKKYKIFCDEDGNTTSPGLYG